MQQAACAGLGKSHYRFGQPPGPNVNPVPSPPLLLLISEETGKEKKKNPGGGIDLAIEACY